jgi:hypothetical protein
MSNLGHRMRRSGPEAVTVVNFSNKGVRNSGGGTATHTFTSETTTDVHTILFIGWQNNTAAARTLSSATWNGNAITILVQNNAFGGSQCSGAAIAYISGAQSGDIVLNLSSTVANSFIRTVGLTDLNSATPVDTDNVAQNAGGGTSVTMTALTDAGVHGAIMLFGINDDQATASSFTNEDVTLDEGTDANARSLVGYVSGIPAGNITFTGGNDNMVLLGASFR